MLLRTPRRRISPRSKRRCRVIRNFFLRALGTSSQTEIKIDSSTALNVTDINYKINDLERQLSTISEYCNCNCNCHCNGLNRSAQEPLQSHLCPSDDDYVTIDSFTDQAPKKGSVTTTLYEAPSERGSQRNRHGSGVPLNGNIPTASKTKNTVLDNSASELGEPYQAKVRKRSSKVDGAMVTPQRTEGECEVRLLEHRTRSALETGSPACAEPACPLTPPLAAPKGPRGRRSHSGRIEPLPPSDDTYTYTRRHKDTKPHRSASLSGHSKKKNTESDNKHYITSKAEPAYHQPRVDRDFIDSLVKKQYLTTKVIGISSRRSNMSQYSEPVCRDRDHSARLTDDLYEYRSFEPYEPYTPYTPHTPHTPHTRYTPYAVDPPPPRPHRHRCHESRSLPSRRARSRPCCTHYDYYNDSDYDMVPVREKKRSPKQRRKYIDYDIYREVPPSPRTLRPRLNLEAQLHADYEDYINLRQHKASTPVLQHRKAHREYLDSEGSEATFELKTRRETKLLKPAKVQTCLPVSDTHTTPPIPNSLQCRNSEIDMSHATNVNTEDISRKTDKTLSEIKDILQNFLEEIKTETFQEDKSNEAKVTNTGNQTSRNMPNMASVPLAAGDRSYACDTTDVNHPPSFTPDVNNSQLFMGGMRSHPPGPTPHAAHALPPLPPAPTSSPLPQMPCMTCPQPPQCSVDASSMMMPNRPPFNTFNNCTVAHCRVPTTFPPLNTCCYPPVPHCAVGCASASPNCGNEQSVHAGSSNHAIHPGYTTSNAALCQHCVSRKESGSEIERSAETEELIKEIHKFLTLHPVRTWEKQRAASQMTSRSVGSSHRLPAPASRHDVTVGTSATRCYSKSCEAIGSRMVTETSHTTRSDTMVDRLSLDISQSDNEYPEVYVRRDEQVKKKKKFKSVLKSMFKKKKSPEAFESTPTTEDMYPGRRNYEDGPFRQELMNYMMLGQEFYKPPPSPPSPRAPRRADVAPPPAPAPPGPERRGLHYHAPPPAPGVPHFPRPHYLSTPPSTIYSPHHLHGQVIPEYDPQYPPPGYPSPYYNHYDRPPYTDHRRYSGHIQHPDHGPDHGPGPGPYQDPRLYLREVEIKSTGTQSSTERKIHFLQKLNRKISPPPPHQPPPPDAFKQPQKFPNPPPPQPSPPQLTKKISSKWKQFQQKVQTDINNDPGAFGLSRDSKFLTRNTNMRTTMLKKMFYKRNPFSPNNLIIRTLLGNDPSSFGVPQGTMRPRLIL